MQLKEREKERERRGETSLSSHVFNFSIKDSTQKQMRQSIWSVFSSSKLIRYTCWFQIKSFQIEWNYSMRFIGMRLLNSGNFECHSFLLPRFMHHLAFLIEPCIFLKMCLCVWISHENSEKHVSQVFGRFWEYLREHSFCIFHQNFRKQAMFMIYFFLSVMILSSVEQRTMFR